MSRLGVEWRLTAWEAHEHDEKIGKNDSIDIGKSQRLRKEVYARFHKVLLMRPGLANIIDIVRISGYFESPETNIHIAENSCGNDHADTWSLKRVY